MAPWRPGAPAGGGGIIAAVMPMGSGLTGGAEALRVGAAAMGVHLGDDQLDQFRVYHRELVAWNRRMNLMADTDWDLVQRRHILDSLSVSVAAPAQVLCKGDVLDVGSGAGFPGLALKIAFPGLKVTLIDATAKKTAFLSHVTGVLALRDVDVVTGRAEELAHDARLRERFDLVLSRAVARMPALAELTLPFCKRGGLVVAQKGAGVDDELGEAGGAIETLGGRLRLVRGAPMDGAGGRAMLVVLEKVRSTPSKYPRGPGTPTKRPLVGHRP